MTLIPKKPDPSPIRKVFVIISLFVLFAALLLLYSYPMNAEQFIPWALRLIIAGVGLYLLTFLLKPFTTERIVTINLSRRGIWIQAAVILSVLTAVMMVVFQKFERQNYLPVLTLWFGAIGCYVSAFANTLPSREAVRGWWRAHWKECLMVGSVTALAAVLRFYKLGDIPLVINGDEGWIGNIALATTSPPYANPFTLWENFGALYLQCMNWAFVLFGTNAFALRLLPAIAGTLAIPALYLLSRQIAGRRVALFAILLLAISHSHINFSRTAAVGYIQDTWLIPLELYLLLSGLQKRSLLRAAIGGAIMGVHFTIYLTPQIFAAMLLVFCGLILLFFRRKFPQAGRTFAAFWGGIGVIILPEAYYAATHASEFFNRLNIDGTFQSGWLTEQMAATGQTVPQILTDRVLHAFLSFLYYPAIDFYGSPIAVLSLFTGILFLIGLGISLWKTRSPSNLLLNGYFLIGPLAIGLFSIPATADSYRIIMVLPAAMLLAAIGLDSILESLGLGWNTARLTYIGVTAFLFVNLFIFNQWVYFVDVIGKCRYGGDQQTRFASYLGRYLSELKPAESVYLLSNEVFRYGTHFSADFLSRNKPVVNVPEGIETISPITGDVIISNPDRIDELYAWIRDHPGGKLEVFYDCQVLFLVAYHVP
jgi:hypothetical protein